MHEIPTPNEGVHCYNIKNSLYFFTIYKIHTYTMSILKIIPQRLRPTYMYNQVKQKWTF